MATSGTSTFDATRDQIITSALRKIAVIGEDESANTYQLSNGAFVLNTVIKEAQVDGMPLWAIQQATIPASAFVNGEVSIGLGQPINIPAPLKVIEAYLRNNTTNTIENISDIPLMSITRNEYNSIASKFSRGTPTQYHYDPKSVNGILYVWPIFDTNLLTTHSVVITYQRPFEDAGLGTNTLDFPSYWINALVYQLAMRLAPEYGVPPQDRTQLKQEAQFFWERALSFGTEEGSLFISPDTQRGGGNHGTWGY